MSSITIGHDKNGKALEWDLRSDKLPNRHLLILGSTGSGKTYVAAHMLRENSRNGLPAIVFDYADSFSTSQMDDMDINYLKSIKDKLEYINVRKDKVPVNPFRLLNFEREEKETENEAADRIAGLLQPVFGFGDQQRYILYEYFYLFFQGKIQTDNPLQNLNNYLPQCSKDSLSNSRMRVLSKMASFIDSDPFTNTTINWDEYICNDGKITIFELSKYSEHMRKIVLEFLLWDLFDYASRTGSKNRPFVTVFDECHELKFTKASPVFKVLRQGRKFGFSAWFITQYLGQKASSNDEMIDLLEQAQTKLFFQPTHNDLRYVADSLNPNDYSEWMCDVSNLQRGECIVKGYFVKQSGNTSRTKEYPAKIIKIPKL